MVDSSWKKTIDLVGKTMDLPISDWQKTIDLLPYSQAEEALIARHIARSASEFLLKTGGGLLEPIVENTTKILPNGTRLGAWKVTAHLAQGGMAEVYQVKRADGAFAQTAALKLLSANHAKNSELFMAEREVLARIEHPAISRLIDGGQTDSGQLWLVMELVQGQTLRDYQQSVEYGQEQIIKLILQACEAVSHAHANLVLHRDLNPDNVIIDTDGRVRLVDFGVAALLDAQNEDEQAPLSLEFAAPEQIRHELCSTATDVYGLGGLLLFALTGHPPRPISSPVSLAIALRSLDNPISAPGINQELDSIICKALSPDAKDRYESVQALATDLKAWISKNPVSAMPDHPGYRIGKFLQRRPLATFTGMALLFFAVIAAFQWQRAEWQRDVAIRESQRLTALHDAMGFILSEARLTGESTSAVNAIENAAERLLQTYDQNPEEAGRALKTMGDLYYEFGDLNRAQLLYERSLTASRLSDEKSIYAAAELQLAELAVQAFQFERANHLLASAKSHYQQNARMYEGELDRILMLSALIDVKTGDTANAIRKTDQLLAKKTVVGGPSRIEVLDVKADAMITLNRLEDAEKLDQEANQLIAKSGRPLTHADIMARTNSATLYFSPGNYHIAEKKLTVLADLQRELYGESEALIQILHRLSAAMALQGKNELALKVHDEAIPMAEKFMPGTNTHIFLLYNSARFLTDAGYHERARTTIFGLQKELANHPDIDTPLSAMLVGLLAKSYALSGDQIEAEKQLIFFEQKLVEKGDAMQVYQPYIDDFQKAVIERRSVD